MKIKLLLLLVFIFSGILYVQCTELVHISDIHFDPYYDSVNVQNILHSDPGNWRNVFENSEIKDIGNYGSETNYNLLKDLISGIKKNSPGSGFLMITGDMLVHSFIKTYVKYSGTDNKDSVSVFALRTIKFVTGELRKAFPEKKIIFALGNNDSNIDNYAVDTGGEYLAQLYDWIRLLNEDQKITIKNDEQSYRSGGYYSVRLNDKKKVRLILLNTVVFSTYFRDSGLDTNNSAGLKELSWFESELKSAAKKKEKVWLAFHIAPGIDVYKTIKSANCNKDKIVTFWKDAFTDKFLALQNKYKNVISGNFGGHIHMDNFNVILKDERPISFIKLSPAISPVYLNNPGFSVYEYNENTGALNDYSVYYRDLVNRSSEWQKEYSFKERFNLTPDKNGFTQYKDQISSSEDVRKSYIDFYPVGNQGVSSLMLSGYKPFLTGIFSITREDYYNAACAK